MSEMAKAFEHLETYLFYILENNLNKYSRAKV